MDTATPSITMRLDAIWRYPVKSLQGERLAEATLDSSGLRGDRCWGVRDEGTGKILTGRREPQLLLAAASLTDDGEPDIVLPSGDRCRGVGPETDAALSDWLHRPVTLIDAVEAPPGTAEFFADATDDTSPAIEWTMPPGRFVDASPLLMLTTASLRTGAALYPAGDWDVRRFRPNVLIEVDADGWVEDGWCGQTVHLGAAEVLPRQPCVRCTMVTRPQPEITRDLDIYKTVARHHGGTLGVWTDVKAAGSVRVGDPVIIST
ncbi:MAG: MOSC domain-containing protein [Ilumatobacteraceae bacterium]